MAITRLRTRRGSEHMVDSQPSQLQQDTPELLLELDAFLAPPATVLLSKSRALHHWRWKYGKQTSGTLQCMTWLL